MVLLLTVRRLEMLLVLDVRLLLLGMLLVLLAAAAVFFWLFVLLIFAIEIERG